MLNSYIGELAIHRSSDVWLPRYAPIVADMGVFKVVEVPTNWYEYLISKTERKKLSNVN